MVEKRKILNMESRLIQTGLGQVPEKSVVIEPNANYHHTAGQALHDTAEGAFGEYRRKWREWPEKFFVGEFPLFIDIEATSVCNLKCHFCATTFRQKDIKNGFVSFETVKKIIDEGSSNGLYGVKFNIRGEPLLHPEIHAFVDYAKQKGIIDVYFNTNAMLLTEDVSKKLIDAGLDRISVSVEGCTKEVYEKNRIGADFDTVVSNIEAMRLIKKKMRCDHPRVRVQTVMLPDLRSNVESYTKFWEARADEVGFLDYKEMKEKKYGMKYPWACPQIWQRMAVWWDGTILPCNHNDDGELRLGHIKDTYIKQAWHSDALKGIRETHKAGEAHTIRVCDGCYLRNSEIEKHLR